MQLGHRESWLLSASAAVITEREYREIEAHLDEALAVFHEQRFALSVEDRQILDNLLEARREVHDLRILQEAEEGRR